VLGHWIFRDTNRRTLRVWPWPVYLILMTCFGDQIYRMFKG
jgi:hypothetical protein